MRAGRLGIASGTALVALLAAGCLGDSTPGTDTVGEPCVPTVALNPGSLTLAPGESGKMTVTVTPCSTASTIHWIITDTAVAKATPLGDTSATIRAGIVGTTGVVASLAAQPAVVAPGTIYVR